MALRKHKYKQRLVELEARIKRARQRLLASLEPCDDFKEGMLSAYADVLVWMTVDEEAEQAKDEEARTGKNVKKARRRREKSEKDLWCANCMATFAYADAYYFDGLKEHLSCPECKANDVRAGTGPKDKRAP